MLYYFSDVGDTVYQCITPTLHYTINKCEAGHSVYQFLASAPCDTIVIENVALMPPSLINMLRSFYFGAVHFWRGLTLIKEEACFPRQLSRYGFGRGWDVGGGGRGGG